MTRTHLCFSLSVAYFCYVSFSPAIHYNEHPAVGLVRNPAACKIRINAYPVVLDNKQPAWWLSWWLLRSLLKEAIQWSLKRQQEGEERKNRNKINHATVCLNIRCTQRLVISVSPSWFHSGAYHKLIEQDEDWKLFWLPVVPASAPTSASNSSTVALLTAGTQAIFSCEKRHRAIESRTNACCNPRRIRAAAWKYRQ